VAAKPHTTGVHLVELGETKDLKATAVRQHRPSPAHESVQAAELLDGFDPGSERQMVEIGKQDASAGLLQSLRSHTLHRAQRRHRHESRCLHLSMGKSQQATTSLPVAGNNLESHW
jgi:hypothetical protein